MWLELDVEVALARAGGGCRAKEEEELKRDGKDEGVRKQAEENGRNGDNNRGTSIGGGPSKHMRVSII
jgi:hypothetical protein